MPTGACGINCDVCRLNLLEICSTCGPGKGPEAQKKLAAQQTILGAPCPILLCASKNHVDHCPRDCGRFPCDAFRTGPYPFSHGFLSMQERRRNLNPPAKTPSGDIIKVPAEHWEDLKQRDLSELCGNALATAGPLCEIFLPFLGEDLLIDREHRRLSRLNQGRWEIIDDPLLELLCLVYLLTVGPEPLEQEMISVHELKDAHFFQGPHELKVRPLVERYGNDLNGFRKAAERLGGDALDLADAAYRLPAFPKVPIYYLFWEGDEEFKPRLSILFDRSIALHFSADAIWGIVNLVSTALLKASFPVSY
jgi:hypothetical protein